MLRCSPEAFAKCQTRQYCGSREEATFTEDSECAKFNKTVMDRTFTNGDQVRCMRDDELALFMAEQMAQQNFLRLECEGAKLSEIQKMALVERLYFTWMRWLLAPAEKEVKA